MLQHNHWGNDGWVPFAKYWDPGPRIDVHRMSQWSTDKSVRIHYLFSATVLLSTSECPLSPG